MSTDEGQAKSLEVKKQIPEQHMLMGYWAAHGFDAKQIAKKLQYSEVTVKSVLRTKEVQTFIKKVRHEVYGEQPALHIKECANRAINVADEIMMNKKVKPHIRQEVAFKFMDRAYGKPGLEVDLGEGTVKKLLAMIQNQKDVDIEAQPAKNDIEDAQYAEIPQEAESQEPQKESDSVDDWINKNIK